MAKSRKASTISEDAKNERLTGTSLSDPRAGMAAGVTRSSGKRSGSVVSHHIAGRDGVGTGGTGWRRGLVRRGGGGVFRFVGRHRGKSFCGRIEVRPNEAA